MLSGMTPDIKRTRSGQKMDNVLVHMSIPTFYRYNGWLFEYSETKPFPPWPCRKDFELRKRAGKKFYEDISGFFDLSENDKMQCRVYL